MVFTNHEYHNFSLPCLQAVVASDSPPQTSPEGWVDSTAETVGFAAAPPSSVRQEASPLPEQRDELLHSTLGP